jgi:hypothetical protein
VRRLDLRLELVAHRLIGEQIITLTRQQPRDRDLIILIRFDPELTPVMAVGDQRLVQLLHRERERQVLGVPVADVAHQPMKYAI